jgi:hypothetical protein
MLDTLAATERVTPYLRLGEPFRADARWWAAFAHDWNGVSVLFQRPTEWVSSSSEAIRLQTDACETGAGAVCGTHWFAHRWTADEIAASKTYTSSSSGSDSDREQQRSMPYLELLSLTMAAHAWGAAWAGQRVVFENDCEPVVHSVNSLTSHSPAMMTLIRTLWLIAARHGFEFRVTHIPGVTNSLADALSRGDVQDRFRTLHPLADQLPTILSPLPTPTL